VEEKNTTLRDDPVVRFLEKILLDSVSRGATRIRFERFPKMGRVPVRVVEDGAEKTKSEMQPLPWSKGGRFDISIEIDGAFEQTAAPPVLLWEKVIAQLKMRSRMVDYGPRKSENGHFSMQVDPERTATFFMTTNPDPYNDKVVALELSNLTST